MEASRYRPQVFNPRVSPWIINFHSTPLLPYSVLCASPQSSWNVLVIVFEVLFPFAVVAPGSSPVI